MTPYKNQQQTFCFQFLDVTFLLFVHSALTGVNKKNEKKKVSFYAKTIKILKTKCEKVKYASHSPWQPANSKGVVKGRQYGTKKGTRNVRKTRGEQSSDQDLNHAKAFRASLSDPSCTLSEMCRHYTEGERECH